MAKQKFELLTRPVLQIIGKGGIGREVAGYATALQMEPIMFEYECHGIRNDRRTVIAIGDAEARKRVYAKFIPFNLDYFVFGAGQSYGNNTAGAGTIICPGTILTDNITTGIHCLINLNCTIGHDCVMGDFVTMSPGVNVSGNVTIGNGCYIGTNAVIREKITICDNVVIGAGGVVVKDITEPGVYVGNPVKKIG